MADVTDGNPLNAMISCGCMCLVKARIQCFYQTAVLQHVGVNNLRRAFVDGRFA